MDLRCRLGRHAWQDCKCMRCGLIRDDSHRFRSQGVTSTTPGPEQCVCQVCGKVNERAPENAHAWAGGCVCKRCGKRRDSNHRYHNGVCRDCGKVMPVDLGAMSEAARARAVFDDQFAEETRRSALASVSNEAACAAYSDKSDAVSTEFIRRLSRAELLALVERGHTEPARYITGLTSEELLRCAFSNARGDLSRDSRESNAINRVKRILSCVPDREAICAGLLTSGERILREAACQALGGHEPDPKCVCRRCGAICHDWEEREYLHSFERVCRRCGKKVSWQAYND